MERKEKYPEVTKAVALLGDLADTCVSTGEYTGLATSVAVVGARLDALTQLPDVLSLGACFITPEAVAVMTAEEMRRVLDAQRAGVWGDLDPEDREANDAAVLYGNRVLSAWVVGDGVRVWVITEADRSSTTILLPEEY